MLKLRKATFKDSNFLWELKNDPIVLLNSYIIRKPVEKEEYMRWFKRRLEDEKTELYIVENNNEAIGDVRLDIDKEIEISIRLHSSARGKGFAVKIVKLAIKQAEIYSKNIVAYIVDGNIPSMRTFLQCGFIPVSYEKGPVVGRYKYVR